MAAALAGGWLLLLRRRLPPAAKAAALFSLISFVLLAVFYLRLWAIASRYLVDFAPAISFSLVALLYAAFTLKRLSRALCAVTFALVIWGIAGAWFGQPQNRRVLYAADEARDKMPHPRFDGPPLPDHYECGLSLEARTGIPMNGLRWNAATDCQVQVQTPLYLPSRRCVRLRLRGDTSQVRVKRGLTFLERVSDEPIDSGIRLGTWVRTPDPEAPRLAPLGSPIEQDRLLTFCAPDGARQNPTGIEIVFLGWSDVASLPGPKLRLLSVTAQ
jgi:hypothetical protein